MIKNLLQNTAVVILAGGKQLRFMPISHDLPKAMASVGLKRKPHLEYLVEYLLKRGIRKIVISVSFLSDIISSKFYTWKQRGVDVLVDQIDNPGTGGALKYIVLNELLKCTDKPIFNVIYWNADTLISGVDPINLILRSNELPGLAGTIVLTQDKTAPNYGAIRVCGNFITEFDEKSCTSAFSDNLLPQFAHGGVGLLNLPRLLDIFLSPPCNKQSFDLFTDVLPLVVSKGCNYLLARGRFLEWGVPERFILLKKNPQWVENAYQT